MTSLRPDEQATYSEIGRAQSRDQKLKSGLKLGAEALGAAALTTAAPIKALGSLGSKIMPFLNSYVPVDLALKGISTVNPQLGSFLKKGMEHGLNLKDGLEFLKENLDSKQQEEEPKGKKNAKESRNIIEQYDPELHTYIKEKLGNGESPLQAGNQALKHGRFKKAIDKLTKDHKTPWSSILESVYGPEVKAQPQGQQQQQPPTQGMPQQQAQQQGRQAPPQIQQQQQQQTPQGQPPQLNDDLIGGLGNTIQMMEKMKQMRGL